MKEFRLSLMIGALLLILIGCGTHNSLPESRNDVAHLFTTIGDLSPITWYISQKYDSVNFADWEYNEMEIGEDAIIFARNRIEDVFNPNSYFVFVFNAGSDDWYEYGNIIVEPLVVETYGEMENGNSIYGVEFAVNANRIVWNFALDSDNKLERMIVPMSPMWTELYINKYDDKGRLSKLMSCSLGNYDDAFYDAFYVKTGEDMLDGFPYLSYAYNEDGTLQSVSLTEQSEEQSHIFYEFEYDKGIRVRVKEVGHNLTTIRFVRDNAQRVSEVIYETPEGNIAKQYLCRYNQGGITEWQEIS